MLSRSHAQPLQRTLSWTAETEKSRHTGHCGFGFAHFQGTAQVAIGTGLSPSVAIEYTLLSLPVEQLHPTQL